MPESTERIGPLAGRVFLSLIFILAGLGKLFDWSGTADYMATRGMVAIPFFLAMAIIFEILGGLSVLLGFKTRVGAIALFLFMVPTTLLFHDFWAYPPDEQALQRIMLLKNLAIMGGLLILAASPPHPWSLDGRRAAG